MMLPLAPLVLLAATLGAPKPRLETPWTRHVSRSKPHPEYPRPQMVRSNWTNLNGPWDFAIRTDAQAPASTDYARKILVPFPVESYLSGIEEPVPANATLWYRRTFDRPKGERTILHFEASDWKTRVWVNGKAVGVHEGGYDPFSFDVTDALKAKGDQSLVVAVEDPTDAGTQPRGKQVRRPGGIYYTPSSGIWQTVWLEGVPRQSIERLKIMPRNDGTVTVQITQHGSDPQAGWIEVRDGKRLIARSQGWGKLALRVPEPKLWSPESPNLYDLRVGLGDGKKGDVVQSYFGFREVSVGKAPDGKTRILLNGKPLFMVGPLDQGFWPDGLYTPPTEAAMKEDLEVTKRLGFNMVRKHVKVEPATWYAACDRMGLLVWQDMPSGDRSIRAKDADLVRTPESAAIFERELKAMIDTHVNSPSIVTWVVFNEGWGQFDTARVVKWVQEYDPSRIVDGVTGWADRGVGDMHDIHRYPGPASPNPEPTRAAVLGEFGGLGMPTPGHMWEERSWGYRTFKSKEELTAAYERLFRALRLLIPDPGLSAAVYTQTTDVETEANGLMTYDRKVMKMDERRVRKAVTDLFGPPLRARTLVPTSETNSALWRYTTTTPGSDWAAAGFDDAAWTSGQAPFGATGTPTLKPRTEWRTDDLWMRRTFTLSQSTGTDLAIRIFHVGNAEVFLDGKKVATVAGHTNEATLLPLDPVKGGLTKGEHTLAVHCHKTEGMQGIDVGLLELAS